MEFNKDELILLNVYLKNSIINSFNKKAIILIIYNKSLFLTNNR